MQIILGFPDILGLFIQEIQNKQITVDNDGPEILRETVATAWVEGNNSPGK